MSIFHGVTGLDGGAYEIPYPADGEDAETRYWQARNARIEETRWGRVYHYRGRRWAVRPDVSPDCPVAGRWHELPQWQRPRAALFRATDDQRWENWRQVALTELDEEFPTEEVQ